MHEKTLDRVLFNGYNEKNIKSRYCRMKSVLSDWQWGAMSIKNVVNVKTDLDSRHIVNRGDTYHYQLGIKFTGHSILRYKGHVIDYTPGSVAYLPKEDTTDIDYTTDNPKNGNGVCIFFTSELPLPKDPQLTKNVGAEIENAFLKVFQTYANPDQNSYLDVMAEFYKLLSRLDKMKNDRAENDRRMKFEPAIKYFKLCRTDEYPDIKYAANLCGMSDKYFRDSFKKVMNISPLQFFHKQKMLYIKELISDLSLTVSEVSFKCGFSDPNYFSRFFKRYFGLSPSEYRNFYCKKM